MNLDELFKEAVILIQNLDDTISQNHILKLYGLYKQSLIGDNKTPKPMMIQTREYYKWNAWNKCKEMTSDQAKTEYVKLVSTIIQYSRS